MLAEIIFIIGIVLLIAYCCLIILYTKWFNKLEQFSLPGNTSPANSFSIIIPARNEADNISNCINSIMQNNYPQDLFEVIVVDDFSTDTTTGVVKDLQRQYANLQLIQLSDVVVSKLNSYKKKAIETAISRSKHKWTVTTDADCKVNTQWLQLYDTYIQQHNPVFVAAPAMFTNNNTFISVFQCLDFMSLQGITAASVSTGFHSMCNGANLAYRKDIFSEVDGFKGVDNIASGDDMLLMHKIQQQHPKQIGYLFSQNAIVETLPMYNWKSFINQRIRWASKARSYTDKRIFWVLLLVYVFNLFLFLCLFIGIFIPVIFIYLLIFIACKTICELFFMQPVAKFFKQEKLLWWFPLMQPFHIVYTVISGLLGNFGKYEWKGRTVK